MTAYKDIVGQKITKVSSDPSNVKTGQMFYNTSTNQLKALAISEAWSSAPATLNLTIMEQEQELKLQA